LKDMLLYIMLMKGFTATAAWRSLASDSFNC
jgi:hypothetical protein